MQTQLNYNVAVTMRNNGTTTWTPGALYRLGSQNSHDNQIWGPGRIELASAVAPGQQYTFNFQVKAPAPGDYQMQWGMVQDNVQWFGAAAGSPVVVTEDLSRVTFIHTDGLGSPVARTNGAGVLISRTRYEPYGYVATGTTPTIGFTGHVNDADTGLTYMQQRYYDPVAGRFLSVDQVVTDANTGNSFNRYAYANNSPYKFVDPDGRSPEDWLPAGAPIVAHGKFLGAAAAYAQGALTGDQSLQDLGAKGMAENKAASIEGLIIVGSMGRGGAKSGPVVDPVIGAVGRVVVSSKGNAMLEPVGGKTVPAGKSGQDTHTLYPNGSNAQRLNEHGHPPNNSTPHGHGHKPGSGPGMKGQGPSTDPKGNIVKSNSSEAHWPIN